VYYLMILDAKMDDVHFIDASTWMSSDKEQQSSRKRRDEAGSEQQRIHAFLAAARDV
jgi:hypothetical protein